MSNTANLKGNQEGKTPIVYDYYPTGVKRAILVHLLKDDECSSCWEEKPNHYTNGNKVFRRLSQ